MTNDQRRTTNDQQRRALLALPAVVCLGITIGIADVSVVGGRWSFVE